MIWRNLCCCLLLWVFISSAAGEGEDVSELNLSDEDRQIVGLLERIEVKFENLDPTERKQFVEKMSTYEDSFSSVLDKVESIPGMLGLNVQMLRENLGIYNKAENVEEIFDSEPSSDDQMLESAINLMEKAAAFHPDSQSVSTQKPVKSVSTQKPAKSVDANPGSEPSPSGSKKTLDDVYNVLTQLVELVLLQISHEASKTEISYANPSHNFLPITPFMQQGSPYHYPSNPSLMYPNKLPSRSAFSSWRKNVRNKRKRRSVKENETPADQKYAKWYNKVYLPWYRNYQKQMNEYYLKLAKYEMDVYYANLPTNPFGDVANSKNDFYKYSKNAYNNFLHEQVKGLDPESIHKEAFDKWKCERTSTSTDGVLDEGQSCWCNTVGTPHAYAGFCGTVEGDNCVAAAGNGCELANRNHHFEAGW